MKYQRNRDLHRRSHGIERSPSTSVSRRGFMQMAGAAGLVAGAARWMPGALAHSSAAPAVSIAPQFPQLPGRNLYIDGGVNFSAFLAYDPLTDPNAKYFRSHVPRAARIDAFTRTQAQPNLSPLPQVADFSNFNYVLDSGSTLWNIAPYGISNDIYITRFQQYRDIVSYWQVWTSIPNPGLTDVAHRNGAKCIAIMFNSGPSNFDTSNFLQKDAHGEFIVGNKLVD